jgi:hypothetical protein
MGVPAPPGCWACGGSSTGQLPADRRQVPQFVRAQLGGHRAGDGAGMPAADLVLPVPAGLGERQADAAPIGGIRASLDESAFDQPIHHAGQRRLAEQDVPVQLAHAHRLAALGQGVEHVVLAHGQVLPDVLGCELLHQPGVGGQQGLPGVVGQSRPAGHHRLG